MDWVILVPLLVVLLAVPAPELRRRHRRAS
jgi:hypothetical protein